MLFSMSVCVPSRVGCWLVSEENSSIIIVGRCVALRQGWTGHKWWHNNKNCLFVPVRSGARFLRQNGLAVLGIWDAMEGGTMEIIKSVLRYLAIAISIRQKSIY